MWGESIPSYGKYEVRELMSFVTWWVAPEYKYHSEPVDEGMV